MLNIFPVGDIQAESPGDWTRERFKASLNFRWIGEDGMLFHAPNAQFILYPKYPEVRFSGFLFGCTNAPSDLMTVRQPGRLLFLSVSAGGQTLGYVTGPDSTLAAEFEKVPVVDDGLFKVLEIIPDNGRSKLITELNRIHQLNWIASKRLNRQGDTMSCNAPNCGGYTLEAELGITPNGYSEPDYLGWEVKQFNAKRFDRLGSEVITLMTPEPTEGFYVSKGVDYFIRTHRYADLAGRPDRLNFGGVHIAGIQHARTHLTMQLIGFDTLSGKIRSSTGRIALVDKDGNEAAAWSFASLLKHWNRKHNQACYVPSLSILQPTRQYRYGNLITLGVETDFQLFLQQMAKGNIYYDPGIKMEFAGRAHPIVKRRSQFRIKATHLGTLYRKNETVDVTKE